MTIEIEKVRLQLATQLILSTLAGNLDGEGHTTAVEYAIQDGTGGFELVGTKGQLGDDVGEMRDVRQEGGGSTGDGIGREVQGVGVVGDEQVDQIWYSVVALQVGDQLAGFGAVSLSGQVVVADA
jgi:hypothetical protein